MSTATAIDAAFAERPDLRKQTRDALEESPKWSRLFGDIASYVQELKDGSSGNADGHTTKKRKLEGAHADRNGIYDNGKLTSQEKHVRMNTAWSTAYTVQDVSFSVPQRKKLTLQIGLDTKNGIRAVNPKTEQTEFGILMEDIEHVVCLPVPEKAQAAYNFCVFPKYGDGVTKPPPGMPAPEPIVWTVPDAEPKKGDGATSTLRETIVSTMRNHKVEVLEPDTSEFVSQIAQAHRKGEKAYHVKAFRGSKDGFLFFLSTGILWGFKKPLLFFSSPHIDSISYTSVLQRTFNLNITTRPSSDHPTEPPTQEFEFSMIDQSDFAGIDTYIKRHRLQDASMAEQRRAKKVNVNGVKKDSAEGMVDGEGASELDKARREVEAAENVDDDDEEEDDENFDPGSEGESEGSGSSVEEEEEGEDGDGRAEGNTAGGGDADSVEEDVELGSEIEDDDDL